MAIPSTTSADGTTVTITLPVEFGFQYHKEFREFHRNAAAATRFILDFAKTHYIDSSALGMLLLMREELGADNNRIKLINCQQKIRALLELANLHKLFNVA